MFKSKKLIKIALLIIIFPFLFVALGWSIIFVGMWIVEPNPPRPQKTYAEFPFELTYEIDGDTITIRDVYICEYKGVGFDEGNGKYRKWNGYIKSTGEPAVFLTEDADRKIYCFVGDAEYYMGEESDYELQPLTPRIYDEIKEYSVDTKYFFSSTQIMHHYKIKIIDWEFTEPIKNSFD